MLNQSALSHRLLPDSLVALLVDSQTRVLMKTQGSRTGFTGGFLPMVHYSLRMMRRDGP